MHQVTISSGRRPLEDGAHLLTGGDRRVVTIRSLADLAVARPRADGACDLTRVPAFGSPIRSLALSQNERHLLVGLQDGLLYVLALDAHYLRERLQQRLTSLGFL